MAEPRMMERQYPSSFDLNVTTIMSAPPRDSMEFWIRFGCAFVFFGFIFAVILVRYVDGMGLLLGIAVWVVATVAVSCYAARVGDEAWHKLIGGFRWWS